MSAISSINLYSRITFCKIVYTNVKMRSIARIVEDEIEQKPFLQEALSRGIINHAALAEELILVIEKELKTKVKFSAVNMAIRRLSEKLEKTFVAPLKFDEHYEISAKSGLVEITFYKTPETIKKTKEIYNLVDTKIGDLVTITQGFNEIMIITNRKYESKIKEISSGKEIKKIIRDLGSVTLTIPLNAVETLGLFYACARAINWNNVNIVDIVSTLTEMTFIVKEDDLPKAFNSLNDLIKNKN
jgi:hypothetical protein